MTVRRFYMSIPRNVPISELEFVSVSPFDSFARLPEYRVVTFDLDIPEPDNLGEVEAVDVLAGGEGEV